VLVLDADQGIDEMLKIYDKYTVRIFTGAG
jgi:hypothetical protein